MRVHISAKVEVFTEGRHRSCPVIVHTDTHTDRTTNLIISSNVHFVLLSEIKKIKLKIYKKFIYDKISHMAIGNRILTT